MALVKLEETLLLFENLFKELAVRGLKVFHQNINGLDSKIEMLKILLQETKKSIHLLGITESHLSNTHVDAQFEIDGYKMIRSDRARGQGGGVCIYMRDGMN